LLRALAERLDFRSAGGSEQRRQQRLMAAGSNTPPGQGTVPALHSGKIFQAMVESLG